MQKEEVVDLVDFEILQSASISSRSVWTPWLFVTAFSALVWMFLDVAEKTKISTVSFSFNLIFAETVVYIIFQIKIFVSSINSIQQKGAARFFLSDWLLQSSRTLLLLMFFLNLALLVLVFELRSNVEEYLFYTILVIRLLSLFGDLIAFSLCFFSFPFGGRSHVRFARGSQRVFVIVSLAVSIGIALGLFRQEYVQILSSTDAVRVFGLCVGLAFLHKMLPNLHSTSDHITDALVDLRRRISLDSVSLEDSTYELDLIRYGMTADALIRSEVIEYRAIIARAIARYKVVEDRLSAVNAELSKNRNSLSLSLLTMVKGVISANKTDLDQIYVDTFDRLDAIREKIRRRVVFYSAISEDAKKQLEHIPNTLLESTRSMRSALSVLVAKDGELRDLIDAI